jgi:hypothetical protein
MDNINITLTFIQILIVLVQINITVFMIFVSKFFARNYDKLSDIKLILDSKLSSIDYKLNKGEDK